MLKFANKVRTPYSFKKSSIFSNVAKHSLFNPVISSVYRNFSTKKDDPALSLPKDEGRDTADLIIGVPAETFAGENRVAISPNAVKLLKKQGFNIAIESGAGMKANFMDSDYIEEGAEIVDRNAAMQRYELIFVI